VDYNEISAESRQFINSDGYTVPVWKSPEDQNEQLFNVNGWVFLSKQNYKPYWNPCEWQTF
jgi:hypothetical protein